MNFVKIGRFFPSCLQSKYLLHICKKIFLNTWQIKNSYFFLKNPIIGGNLSVTRLQVSDSKALRGFLSVTNKVNVTDKKGLKPLIILGCNRVTDKKGGYKKVMINNG